MKSKNFKKTAGAFALCSLMAVAMVGSSFISSPETVEAATEKGYTWDSVKIGGGGFVSGIVTGKNAMYARTDVGGAYRYDYDKDEWVQLMAFVNEEDRGYLSVDAICIDPTDDDTIYLLCGCAYFSSERTAIFKSTDGGKTFTEHDVTDLIKVHGNGYGRQCGEAIAVDPENPDIIYCGGDTDGLIMSKDGGETWGYVDSFNDLGLFTNEIKWPTWGTVTEKTTVGTDYGSCNGIATIAIQDGKVYVGVSDNTIGANVYVADVGKDNWKPLSKDLPTDAFPSRINKDADGNLLICYVGGLTFTSSGGGIYKYDTKSDKVTDISPTGNSFGGCVSLPDDSKTLVATTCGVWSSQLWYKDAWADDNVCWGDQFYRSTDGGQTWESITPGNEKSYAGPLQADYLQNGGYDWIENKAIHWCGAMVIDPRDTDRVFVTSGNGVFACDNVWDELPQFYFHPDGIEEVVALDMISVPGGDEFSAIGDYDGFKHTDVTVPGEQHSPNMGSTGAIAYCPQNPDVMVRIAENQNDVAPGYYTTDGGKTWNKMANSVGGKAAITKIDDDTYRILKSNKDDGNVSYSDDWGQTWESCSGISSAYGSKTTYMLVEPEKPNVVYAYATYYNSSWFYSKSEAEFSDAHYTLYVSTDYGKTFTGTDIAMYDQCDSAGRIAYLGEDNLMLGAGWYGMYNVTDGGKTVEKTDVYYCKTVGYGAPEKKGGLNTLYMYGKPKETDDEGIYRSTDGGKTWVCINTDNLYGGTGNGNFLVGDMNEFGTVYMSTVGCGIVYGKISGDTPDDDKPATTTTEPAVTTTSATTTKKPDTTTTTSEPATTTTAVSDESTTTAGTTIKPDDSSVLLGDVNLDGAIDVVDVTALKQGILQLIELDEQQQKNANVIADDAIDVKDLGQLLKYIIKVIDKF